MRGFFGPLAFEIMTGPKTASIKQVSKLPEHPRIEDKGVLQWTGYELDVVKMTWRFDYLHCNPVEMLEMLRYILMSHEPYPLVTVTPYKGTIYGLPYGGTDYFANEYVLKDMSPNVLMTDHSGRLTVVEVQVTLIECIQDAAIPGLGFGGILGGFVGDIGGFVGGLVGGAIGGEVGGAIGGFVGGLFD